MNSPVKRKGPKIKKLKNKVDQKLTSKNILKEVLGSYYDLIPSQLALRCYLPDYQKKGQSIPICCSNTLKGNVSKILFFLCVRPD